jgi:enoyl-CoA hydratase/carnithine racemase
MSETTEAPRVLIDVVDGVADVRLNRAEKMNALDDAMFRALRAAGESLATDTRVRAVVLSGEGRAFCAGLDVSRFATLGETGDAEFGPGHRPPRPPERITNDGQHTAWVWAELPVPVIAAVHGVAVGAGLQIAMAADLRIVAPDTRLAVLEVRWGITPDGTGTHTLPRLVGLDRAKELTWTGRMVSGEEAVQIGLATRVSADPRADALALARTIAAQNPDAVAAAKRLLNASPGRPAADQFVDEEQSMGRLIGAPNQVEAVRAYFEQRPPVFADRA